MLDMVVPPDPAVTQHIAARLRALGDTGSGVNLTRPRPSLVGECRLLGTPAAVLPFETVSGINRIERLHWATGR